MRILWFSGGLLMLALAAVGAVLPVMPATIFLILAVACFARSSPRLEQKLLQHPRYGAALRAWREEGAISRAGKNWASFGIALGYAIFLVTAKPQWPLALGVGLFMAASAWWIRSRPLPKG